MQTSDKNSNTGTQGADAKITISEIDALNGLQMFLNADLGLCSTHPSNYLDLPDLCFGLKELFNGLDSFLCGLFKEKGGLLRLEQMYSEAVKSRPHVADNYVYDYSQLMQLLLNIQGAKKITQRLSDSFDIISEKLDEYDKYCEAADK